MKSEKEVQAEIVKHITAKGGYVVKIMRANINGCPDLLCCLNSLFVGVEVKAEKFKNPEKQMSPWQHKHKNMIREANGHFVCVSSLDAFIDYLEDHLIYL